MSALHSQDALLALSDDLLVLIARRMRVLADPARMRILALLEQHEMTVQSLADELLTSHQNVSKHLGVLTQAGICSRRREGSHVWYAVADYTALRIIAQAAASTTGHIEELADIASPRL